MGESGYVNSSWSASAGYSASMLTEDAKVDSSSTRQLLPSSVNISAEYPALPDHDLMNNPSKPYTEKPGCKCKNGKCGDKCPCHCAGPECNIGCLCSGDPLKYNRFMIE